MRLLIYSGQFKKDIKRAKKRGKDLKKLQSILNLLVTEKPLPKSLRDHPLKGEWKPNRDLHIEPDWILIYRIDKNQLCLERTGSHADLFKC